MKKPLSPAAQAEGIRKSLRNLGLLYPALMAKKCFVLISTGAVETLFELAHNSLTQPQTSLTIKEYNTTYSNDLHYLSRL